MYIADTVHHTFATMKIMSIKRALQTLSDGNIIILLDEHDRENEGDFVQAAQFVTPQSVNFMISKGRGLVCQAITQAQATHLELSLQASKNSALHETAFTVSVDYKHGTTTGISVFDRAKTIEAIENPRTIPEDLARPGHVFPIIAQDGGVRTRQGHTEAAVDLVQLIKCGQSALICEILNEEGLSANEQELEALALQYDIPMIHIREVMNYLEINVI